MESIDCPKDLVGRVIGRRGETINDLQARTGTRIQIDQTVPDGQPCKVVVTGSAEAVAAAVPLIREVMANGPANRSKPPQQMMPPFGGPPGGPPPGYGGYGPPPGYGGYPPPVYAPPPYFGPPPTMPPMQSPPPGYPPQGLMPPQGYPPQGYWGGPPPGYPPPGGPQPTAAQPAPAPGAKVWQEHTGEQGNTFWYNTQTGVSQWEKPADA